MSRTCQCAISRSNISSCPTCRSLQVWRTDLRLLQQMAGGKAIQRGVSVRHHVDHVCAASLQPADVQLLVVVVPALGLCAVLPLPADHGGHLLALRSRAIVSGNLLLQYMHGRTLMHCHWLVDLCCSDEVLATWTVTTRNSVCADDLNRYNLTWGNKEHGEDDAVLKGTADMNRRVNGLVATVVVANVIATVILLILQVYCCGVNGRVLGNWWRCCCCCRLGC